ncbi:hypothetical protein XELAEV_18004917mg, partial [Xenopus laevis]
GKGLFAIRTIRKGETIFQEKPLVSSQFQWNALYRYRACDHCLRSLETAEENAQRLSGNAHVLLPYPELCTVRNGLHQQCPRCQVSVPSMCCLMALSYWLCHLQSGGNVQKVWRDPVNEFLLCPLL